MHLSSILKLCNHEMFKIENEYLKYLLNQYPIRVPNFMI